MPKSERPARRREVDPELGRRVLHERAVRLAAVGADHVATSLSVLTVRLGSRDLALESRFVQRVEPLKQLYRGPGVTPRLLGFTTSAEEVLVVFDLAEALSLPITPLSDMGQLVVVGEHAAEFGFLVDRVYDVESVERESLLPLGTGLAGQQVGCVLGVSGDVGLVLDGAALLRDPRFFVDEGALSEPSLAGG